MILPPSGYLKRLREICDKNDILLIFDEVITGFGRVGNPSPALAFDVTPDLMTTAKGLTNGAVPMGAVFAHRKIYDAFMEGRKMPSSCFTATPTRRTRSPVPPRWPHSMCMRRKGF